MNLATVNEEGFCFNLVLKNIANFTNVFKNKLNQNHVMQRTLENRKKAKMTDLFVLKFYSVPNKTHSSLTFFFQLNSKMRQKISFLATAF